MPGGCGCAGGSCGCAIQAGPGLVVTGTGNASAPFTITLAPTPSSIPIDVAGPLDLSAFGGYSTVLVNLNANATSVILPTAAVAPGRIDLLIRQGAGGSRLITWPAAIVWPGGTDPVLTTTNNAYDWITLIQAAGTWAGVRTGVNLT
jgi:hypothetical protein